jgi:hypothetical protein
LAVLSTTIVVVKSVVVIVIVFNKVYIQCFTNVLSIYHKHDV